MKIHNLDLLAVFFMLLAMLSNVIDMPINFPLFLIAAALFTIASQIDKEVLPNA